MDKLDTTQGQRTKAIESAKQSSKAKGKRKMLKAFAVSRKGETGFEAIKAQANKAEPQRVLTVAALVASGACTLIGSGTLTRSSNPFSPELFVQLTSKTPLKYHGSKGRIDENGLTVEGLNFFNAALAGNAPGGWNAPKEHVRAIRDVLTKGGQATIAASDESYKVTLKGSREVAAEVEVPETKGKSKAKAKGKAKK